MRKINSIGVIYRVSCNKLLLPTNMQFISYPRNAYNQTMHVRFYGNNIVDKSCRSRSTGNGINQTDPCRSIAVARVSDLCLIYFVKLNADFKTID